jgi:hypothetical protein
MALTTIHQGPYQDIPSSASPGLLFLKSFLPLLDSLVEDELSQLPALLAPQATFRINNAPPTPAEKVLPMLSMRAAKVARFAHEVETAWDIPRGGGRTVAYESTSVTVFKDDKEEVECKVKEFNLIELVEVEEGAWKAETLKTWMDSAPVTDRAKAVMGASK